MLTPQRQHPFAVIARSSPVRWMKMGKEVHGVWKSHAWRQCSGKEPVTLMGNEGSLLSPIN